MQSRDEHGENDVRSHSHRRQTVQGRRRQYDHGDVARGRSRIGRNFRRVLALFDGETNHVGSPNVAGARVLGEIVEQARGPKVIAFKKRRRKNSRRKRGHKQDLTFVKITQIVPAGAKAAPVA